MPRKLLLISYLFPPVGGVGVQRALSLAKYLPDCGFEVHVLSARNATAAVWDPGLLDQVPRSVRLHQAASAEMPYALRQKLWKKVVSNAKPAPQQRAGAPSTGGSGLKALVKKAASRVLSPEPEILWVWLALPKARRIVREHGIEVVLVTAPPFTSFLIGTRLKREFPHLTLISDFRDEWIDYYLEHFGYKDSGATRRRALAIETSVVAASDRVVSVTDGVLSRIRKRHPQQPNSKFALIPNGYDPRAFTNFQPRPHHTGRIVVTFLGTVFGPSSPARYLDALDSLPEHIRSRFETRFIGHVAESERPVLSGRKSLVRELGVMPQQQAFRMLEETDYLLIHLDNDFCVTGKLFEYLATGKPVLAVAPRGGEIDRLLAETGAGVCASPDDPEAIKALLTAAAQRNGALASPRREMVARYERPALAAEYGKLIESSIAARTSPKSGVGPQLNGQ